MSLRRFMELVNRTPLPAQVTLMDFGDAGERGGVVSAKATFRFAEGKALLETQLPLPLNPEPVPTALGLLPSDAFFHLVDDRFEVIVLGCAHAPNGKALTEMRVAASVGSVRRELVVTGDRTWIQHEGRELMSSPVPFSVLPLTWERAFGGRATVEVDEGSFVEVADRFNRYGRGYDVARDVHGLTTFLGARPGFPKYAYQRLLPNLERPDERISGPTDCPRPACWATRPMDSALRGAHLLEGMPERDATADANRLDSVRQSFRSASDEWVIDPPAPGAEVRLEGMAAQGPLSFPMPALAVHGDYAIGERRGSIALRPHLMVLLVEERRFYLSYHAMFRVRYRPEEERSMRLRVEPAGTPS